MKAFQRVQPKSWGEAVKALEAARREGVAVEAKGAGTDLVDRLKERTAAPDRVVDLRRLPDGDRIERGRSEVSIGALVTLSAIADGLRSEWPALADACEGAATPQVRNAATLAGNLCQRPRCWYFRSAEFTCLKKGGSECFAQEGENEHHALFGNRLCAIVHPSAAGVALLAYGATLDTLRPEGPRRLPIADFFTPPERSITAENALGSSELITRVRVPLVAGLRSAYRKVKHKQSFDWPLADAAVVFRLEAGVARDVRVVVGSSAPVPFRSLTAEKLVEGRKIDEALAAKAGEAAVEGATPLARNGHKVAILRAVVRRAVLAAAGLPDGSEGFFGTSAMGGPSS